MTTPPSTIQLDAGGTSVILDCAAHTLPVIVYWGTSLGALDDYERDGVALAQRAPTVSGGLEITGAPSILPLASDGWLNTPGLIGSRDGSAFSPRFVVQTIEYTSKNVTVSAIDDDALLTLTWSGHLDAAGIFHQQLRLCNTGESNYTLDQVSLTFPLPATATEVCDTTGRHLRERFPQRHALTTGVYSRESRRGRPGADSTVLLMAGTPGFGFESGVVHGVHLAWSGNHRMSVERSTTGWSIQQAGELFDSGEVTLTPGAEYESPEALGSWGCGLNEMSARFHALVRARDHHPRRPRPVTLNTWEALYFGLRPDNICELADSAAELGIERFVIDDGWFLGRRDDSTGLGDWFVDTAIFPEGLVPVANHIVGLGMEFGLWVEPEMVNPTSQIALEHPDWILQPQGRLPIPARHQQVLDLTNPDAFEYILTRLDTLANELPLSYLKWDHNRDLVEAGSTHTGRSAVHNHTLATYRLLDTLRERHPLLEIESCASGGARVDLGILARTDRVWTSDCIDPIERLPNQRYTGLLLPPELLGTHVGAPRSESTGRTHDLSFRAATALFGHFGVEWDVRSIDAETREELAGWIRWHKELRSFLHTGTVVYADLADQGADLRGIVASDASRGLYAFSQVASASSYPAAVITLPGLDKAARYRVTLAQEPSAVQPSEHGHQHWEHEPLILTGHSLATAGLRPPVLFPEHTALILCERIDLSV